MSQFKPIFNILKHRGSPTRATLQSGHVVSKQDYVFFKDPEGKWTTVKCADYHGAHFVYADPLYNAEPKQVDPNKQVTGRGHVAFMCSCGSPAVIVGATEAVLEDSDCKERLLVCLIYHHYLHELGWGRHANEMERRQWM